MMLKFKVLILSVTILSVASSSSSSDLPSNPELPSYIRIATTIGCAIILMLGTTGNVLVVIVVWRTKELRSSTNLFLVNLSVADLLVLLVCVPPFLTQLHSMHQVWLLGEGMCKAVPYVQMIVIHVSILTILSISFERYYAICQPLKAGYICTQKRALLIIAIIWLLAVLLPSPELLTVKYEMVNLIDESLMPVCLQVVEDLWQKVYYVIVFGFLFLVPFLVLLVVYCHIAKQLMMGRRELASFSEENQMRERKQVVFMLIAVVLSFFTCFLPFRVFFIWIILSFPDGLEYRDMEKIYCLYYFYHLLLFMNSAINPILYNVMSSKFRSSMIRLLRCRETEGPDQRFLITGL